MVILMLDPTKEKLDIKNECGHNLMNVIDKILNLQHHHE
jgi:hypothetical protein